MDITKKYITQNDCYKANRNIVVKGIMLHSVGIVAAITPEGWFQRWNKPGISKAVHYFIDEDTCLQVLPDNHRGWHAGAGANNTHVSFEICEKKPYADKEYAVTMFKRAVELCVELCKKHNLKASDIISHAEGYKKGIASNHGDPDHWWRQYGLTMDKLRAEVDAILNLPAAAPAPSTGIVAGSKVKVTGTNYATGQTIPSWVKEKIYTVEKISGEKVLIKEITSWVYIKDLSLISASAPAAPSKPTFNPYLVRVTAEVLNVRGGAGTSYKVNTTIKKGGVYTIIEEANGWGKLKSGAGWISLKYTEKVK